MGSEPPVPAAVGDSVPSGNAHGGMFDDPEVGSLVGFVDVASPAVGDEVISEFVEATDGALVDDISPVDGEAVAAVSVELSDGLLLDAASPAVGEDVVSGVSVDDAVGAFDTASATVGSLEETLEVVGSLLLAPVTDGAGVPYVGDSVPAIEVPAVGSMEPGEDTGAEVSIAGEFVPIIGGAVSPGQKIVSGGIA